MAPAMKSMKSAMKSGVMTQSAIYASVAETRGLKHKQVKGVVEGIMGTFLKTDQSPQDYDIAITA